MVDCAHRDCKEATLLQVPIIVDLTLELILVFIYSIIL